MLFLWQTAAESLARETKPVYNGLQCIVMTRKICWYIGRTRREDVYRRRTYGADRLKQYVNSFHHFDNRIIWRSDLVAIRSQTKRAGHQSSVMFEYGYQYRRE